MPIQLAHFDDYVRLRGVASLSWICFDCLVVNRPSSIVCVVCDKQRWYQLGIPYRLACVLARRIE